MPGGENFVESDSVTFTRVTRKHAGIYKYATIMIIIVVDNFVIMITIIIVIISIALQCDTTQVHNVTQCITLVKLRCTASNGHGQGATKQMEVVVR